MAVEMRWLFQRARQKYGRKPRSNADSAKLWEDLSVRLGSRSEWMITEKIGRGERI
jgi:hypothetical protein